ncbi:response regulator transcription factor [Actinomycetes bacterium KLBMP 9797]
MVPGDRTVLVVDDHPIVRLGMAAVLRAEPWVVRVLEAATLAAARQAVTLDHPDMAIVDLGLPDGDGLSLIRELPSIAPGCAALVMTMTNDPATVRAVLDAGARGYVLKDSAPELVAAAVRTVAAGGRVLGPDVADRAAPAAVPAPFDRLSPRELRLARLVAAGRTNRQIADQLSITEKTVRNQVAQVTAKLGVPDRFQAALLAHRLGLTTSP